MGIRNDKIIMVAQRPGDTDAVGGRSFDVFIIDWEMAGWLPEFWEAFCASALLDLVHWEIDYCWLLNNSCMSAHLS